MLGKWWAVAFLPPCGGGQEGRTPDARDFRAWATVIDPAFLARPQVSQAGLHREVRTAAFDAVEIGDVERAKRIKSAEALRDGHRIGHGRRERRLERPIARTISPHGCNCDAAANINDRNDLHRASF